MMKRIVLIAGLVVCGGISSAAAEATAGNAAAKSERVVRYRVNQGDVFYGILVDKDIRHLTNSFAEIARGKRDFSGKQPALS